MYYDNDKNKQQTTTTTYIRQYIIINKIAVLN
jgi:hypothetical protein